MKSLIKYLLLIIVFFVSIQAFSQGNPRIKIFHLNDERFLEYVRDSLFAGGGQMTEIEYRGMTDGRDIFKFGADIGLTEGIILSNGYVNTTVMDGGNNKHGSTSKS